MFVKFSNISKYKNPIILPIDTIESIIRHKEDEKTIVYLKQPNNFEWIAIGDTTEEAYEKIKQARIIK